MPCSNGSSIPSPMDVPPALCAPAFAASMIPGPPPVITAYPASASSRPTSTACAQSGWSAGVRAEPNTDTVGPTSARAPNPSTNSDWIRITRHGSECTQSESPPPARSRWSVVWAGISLPRRSTGPLR